MSIERKSRIGEEEVREILLTDEDRQILDNWASIFNEIYRYSKKSKIKLNELELSGNLHDEEESEFFILLKVFNEARSYKPEKITSFLFYSPDGEGTEGVLLEIGNIRADWKNGKAEIYYDDVLQINEDDYSSPGQLEISLALREAVSHQSIIKNTYNLPPRKQTDLLS